MSRQANFGTAVESCSACAHSAPAIVAFTHYPLSKGRFVAFFAVILSAPVPAFRFSLAILNTRKRKLPITPHPTTDIFQLLSTHARFFLSLYNGHLGEEKQGGKSKNV